jgi:DNA-binding NtrC family response regulator
MNERFTVLVLDDEPVVGRALSRIFRHHGVAIATAVTLDEALRVIELRELGAAIIDLALSREDHARALAEQPGWLALERFRSKYALRAAMILTGHRGVGVARLAYRAHATFIEKPFDAEIALTWLRAAKAAHEPRRAKIRALVEMKRLEKRLSDAEASVLEADLNLRERGERLEGRKLTYEGWRSQVKGLCGKFGCSDYELLLRRLLYSLLE